jgi:ketosteroid isomerase-like protein
MPKSPVEVVREQFEATNERDFARAMDLYADDVELVVHPEALMEHGSFSGREVVGDWFGNWFRTFERGYRFEFEECREVKPSVVLLVASHHGRGRASGVEVQGRTTYLYTVRDGRVIRVEICSDRAAALEAAGAPEAG